MPAPSPIHIASSGAIQLHLLPAMANRHGLITGATGTGKTVTLQTLAEAFSAQGVPVFMADVKGDLTGISQPGGANPKVAARLAQLGLTDRTPTGCPVMLWDVFGKQGHPIRTTPTELGPVLLARLLQLNEVQAGVLQLVFKVADEQGLLILDLKDLRAVLQHVAQNAAQFALSHGNVSSASVGAIQRALLALEAQGGDQFFGEPALNLDDWLQVDPQGRGYINLLAADQLFQAPKVYATLLLWMLSELYERLPEAGDLALPKLVFFFDEAHLLFNDAPAALVEKIEQVIRLIRSKAVGVYFVTQNPRDIPDTVLGQLGNRVQHALRAFTPADQKTVRAAAQTFRANPDFDTERAITELGVGEALVSLLDERGQPTVVQRAFIVPPRSQLGPITPAQRTAVLAQSLVAGVYETAVDRESAYEKLSAAIARPATAPIAPRPAPTVATPRASSGRSPQGVGDVLMKTAARAATTAIVGTIGRSLIRGLLGSLFGGGRKR